MRLNYFMSWAIGFSTFPHLFRLCYSYMSCIKLLSKFSVAYIYLCLYTFLHFSLSLFLSYFFVASFLVLSFHSPSIVLSFSFLCFFTKFDSHPLRAVHGEDKDLLFNLLFWNKNQICVSLNPWRFSSASYWLKSGSIPHMDNRYIHPSFVVWPQSMNLVNCSVWIVILLLAWRL